MHRNPIQSYSGNILHRLHEVSCKMFAQKILIGYINRKGRLFRLTLLVRFGTTTSGKSILLIESDFCAWTDKVINKPYYARNNSDTHQLQSFI